MKSHTFTIREYNYIHENWERLSDKEIATALGLRHFGQVRNFRHRNGLVGKLLNKGQFKKGQKPWNAGKAVKPENTQASHFKLGHTPKGTKYDGCVTIRRDSSGRPYRYVRISMGNWDLLHRELWRRRHGEIPEGMCVVFKDKDPMNCRMSNLELITRSENVTRNHNRRKQSQTMRKRIADDRTRIKYGIKPHMKYSERLT